MTIALLVEPDEDTALALARTLRAAGYDVIHAGSCRAARSLCLRSEVAVLELELSDGLADELAGELMADDCVSRVVFYTNCRDEALVTAASRLGQVVSKDSRCAVLLDAVRCSRRPMSHIPPPLEGDCAVPSVRSA